MSEDIITYRMRKLIYTIIFNFFEKEYEEAEDFDLYVVESLKNVIEYLTSENYLSERVKDNVHSYLVKARDFQDNNRSKRIELINDTIGFMNSQTKDESSIFYKLELYKRRKNLKYISYSEEEVKNEVESIHDSICNDLYVLISHGDITDEETFVKEYMPYLTNSSLYYESLNAILYENPSVFRDETFYRRMNLILDINKEIYNFDRQIVKMNNKILKKVNRTIKK